MNRIDRASALCGLILSTGIGFAAIFLGAGSLAGLSESYQPVDILQDDGPQSFQAWMKRRLLQKDLSPHDISHRLLTMPIGMRRATVNAMMGEAFWTTVSSSESERRAMLAIVETGLVTALTTAPSAGDLWLAASKIRSRTVGFDQLAENYLLASYMTAPREAGLAQSRLMYAASVAPLLRNSADRGRQRDRATVRTLFPAFDGTYQAWISEQRTDGANETGD